MTDESLQPSEPPHIAQELRDIHLQLESLTARVTHTESRLGISPEAVSSPARAVSGEKPVPPVAASSAESVAPPGPTPQPAPNVISTPAETAGTLMDQPAPLPRMAETPRPVFSSYVPHAGFAAAPPIPSSAAPVPDPFAPDRVPPDTAVPVRSPIMIGDWENLIGGKWALWVGLFSLFLAVAYFLAYTWKSLPPLPPAARVALGIAAGTALIGAGSFFRNRTQRWFSEGLCGAGLAVLYLSIWAGAQHFHLLSFSTAFTAMAFTTVLGVYLALRFDALSLSVLATLGGFLTPLLLHGSTSSDQGLSLLTYVAVLNAGILAVSIFKRWSTLTWLSFLATILLIGIWAGDDYTDTLINAVK